MKFRTFLLFGGILAVILAMMVAVVHFAGAPSVLNPKGEVARQQYDLLIFSTAIMLIVAIPVFVLLFFIAWKYRETNTKAKYRPNWDGNHLLESIWWGIPVLIVVVLSVVAWQTSHSLDPYRSLDENKQLRVQVVALQWKWLFIYPDHNIASVNDLRIPVQQPVRFDIAADAPMNSFWIPDLGGQIYAMAGMNTTLHLIADQTGEFRGMSSNISGEGFADMHFPVHALSEDNFRNWVAKTQLSEQVLNQQSYNELVKPSVVDDPLYFQLGNGRLYNEIIDKYMLPHSSSHDHDSEHDNHGGHH